MRSPGLIQQPAGDTAPGCGLLPGKVPDPPSPPRRPFTLPVLQVLYAKHIAKHKFGIDCSIWAKAQHIVRPAGVQQPC
jgi:hypothetical protein